MLSTGIIKGSYNDTIQAFIRFVELHSHGMRKFESYDYDLIHGNM